MGVGAIHSQIITKPVTRAPTLSEECGPDKQANRESRPGRTDGPVGISAESLGAAAAAAAA